MDLEGEEQLAAVEAAIAGINPTARRLRTHRCDVDVGAILDLRALAGDRCAGRCAKFQNGTHAEGLSWYMLHARNITVRSWVFIMMSGPGCRALGLGDQAQPGSTADDPAAGRPQLAGSATSQAKQQADGGSGVHPHGSDVGHSGAQALRHSVDSNAAEGIDGRHAHGHHHLHADQVTSVSLRLSGPLDLQRCASAGSFDGKFSGL